MPSVIFFRKDYFLLVFLTALTTFLAVWTSDALTTAFTAALAGTGAFAEALAGTAAGAFCLVGALLGAVVLAMITSGDKHRNTGS